VEVLATYEDRIVAVREGNQMAISFHPELTDDSRIHQYFVDIVRRTKEGRAKHA
jgi:5'-phosphate synthase pdxT subunit